jgi:hypothetical protein
MQGVGPFPGLVQQTGGAAPDFIGATAVVHDGRGQPFLVQLGLAAATWAAAGSPPGVAHWAYVDLSA